ncbi:hypothetical protein FHS31_002798 [Sphingomonas vulcanisoli]|uniref:LPXTG cell wall anchor domain-containing protein n=1 Tax=Sphingomonas vulcanisoli TaxID=1658060 RepID=A0ABX0TUG7_9SPHN|nr:hypothetical protein [Sphingomonas vulcanisoli]NIJ09166.1 hypothetical protein [Sphingomonas vulcanisoli]
MRNNLTPLRPGLTALATVLALSATPVFAQSAETAPAQDAPVISAPPASVETAPVIPAATAPLQSNDTSENTSAPVATATPMATRSPVVIHTADAPVAPAAPVTKAAAPKHTSVAATRTAPEAAPVAAPTPVTTPRAVAPAPLPSAPAPAPAVVKTSTTTSTASDDSRELELAGVGAVGLLALIGGAFALSRRKRDEEEEVLAPAAITTTPVAAEPVAYETLAAAPVTAAPMAIEGAPTTALHEDFDLSRYGAHVQAAYRGPTEDNPSLSLRHRLKRARFMDQRARENGEYLATAEPAIAAERKPVAQNLFGSKFKDGLRSLRPQGGMRPAFS